MGTTGLIIDTRQQAGKHEHVDRWLDAHHVPYRYEKLDFGDYIRDDGFGNISIDTKKDVAELAGNVGKDHARFVRECDRARDAGWRLIILVEQHPEYNDLAKLATWVSGVCGRCQSKRSGACHPDEVTGKYCDSGYKPLQGSTIAKIVRSIGEDHATKFRFCNKRDTARIICETLGIDYE